MGSALAASAEQVVRAELDSSLAPPPRLQLSGFSFAHQNRIVLFDVSCQIYAGEIFGILGPNGCGKSTLLQCLSGLWRRQRGVLHIDGKVLSPDNVTWRQRIGVVFQHCSLDPSLTAFENLLLIARMYSVPRGEAIQRIKALLQFTDTQTLLHRKVRTLSEGSRRRLDLARALLHRPDILILDEPSQGLDPRAFTRLWQQLTVLCRQQGLTVVLTTHRPDEAEQCCRLMILDHGRVVTVDTPAALLAQVGGDKVMVETPQPEALRQQIQAQLGLVGVAHEDWVTFTCNFGHHVIPKLVEASGTVPIHAISLRKPTLAHAFFHLTGEKLMRHKEQEATC